MKRLLAAAVLALMVHGLLFMLAPFQKPERTGRQADDSGRITVSLEHYSPRHIEDDAQEEVALADLEPLEESVSEERPDAREDSSEHVEESDPQPREQSVVKEELDTEQVPFSALKSGEKTEISGATRDLSEMLEREALSQQEIKEARPLYRDNPPPDYPRRAMQRNQQGTVFLEVLVNSRGRVEEIKVAESSGYSILDRAARDAVRDWVFKPGRKAGRPVDTWVRLPVRFELQ
jgi:periplasmic protein TonB